LCSYETLPKVKAALPECGHLRNLVMMEAQSPAQDSRAALKEATRLAGGLRNALLFSDLLLGDQEERYPAPPPPGPMDCAIIMYTSGSTGKPKGVMLCHRNLITAIGALVNIAKFRQRDRYIGYLPLAHVLELLAETSCLMYGVKIGYSSANTLTNKSSKVRSGSKGDANFLRPTLMCSVPLILERIYKSIVETMQRQGWAVEELFHYLMAYKMKWQDRGFDTPLLNKTLFRKIRYFLGGRVRLMLSGGAPLSPDTHSLTRTCICVPLMQGYGLTETTACATVTSIHDRTTGRAGAPLMNVTIKLVNWEEGNYLVTDQPYPRGEIHVGGDNVALGYFRNEEKTREDFYQEDDRRWFRTGDIGEVHADGVLKIIDRKKDLVKLQHGEYVSFGRVEAVLKTCPVVENLCLHALSTKDHVMAVVVPSKDHVEKIREASGVEDGVIIRAVLKQMTEHGIKYGLQKFEIPAQIILVSEEWTPETGLVTAAFKIRRRHIVDFYRQKIDQIY